MENKVFQPKSMKEALNILDKNKGENIKILAGGTDLLLELNKLREENKKLLDISQIKEITYIKKDKDYIYIGALSTFSEISENYIINKHISSLVSAAQSIGSVQIRNRATIGGNIANASPAADSIAVLTSLSAKVQVESKNESRIVPVDDIITGFYENDLKKNEIITEIIIPIPESSHLLYFDKIGSRKSVTIARLNMGVKMKIENNYIIDADIYFGALAKKAFKPINVENYLINKEISEINKKEFNKELSKVVDKAIPGRYSQQYKRNAICGLGDNLLKMLKSYADKGEYLYE